MSIHVLFNPDTVAAMTHETEFDVVIVGGGSAGCVFAARLAESGSHSVLLLEAGPDRRTDLPGEMRDGWRITREFDWGSTSEPNARGEVESVRRKKLLGGTSWVTRFTPRGSPADYDLWAAAGNPGWGFDDVLPYLIRLESDADFGDQPWHGDRGPMPSTRYLDLDYTDAAAAALDALGVMGFPHVEDHNRPGALGAGRMPMSSRDGVRVTTADAYLPVGSAPANLTIRGGAQVADVVFDGERASGVRLLDGSVIEAGWVVLCAGVFGSPSILMRSGIGSAEHLRSVGVRPRLDLPGVGANLADHPATDIEYGYPGPVRGAPILHVMATFHSSTSSVDGPPDMMIWVSDPDGEPASFGINILLLKPHSRGRVGLRSADPTDQPVIELPGLVPSDVQRLFEGYRRAHELAERPEVRRFCSGPVSPIPSGDDELRAMIRADSYSIPHLVGTCAMGPTPDDGAVVDASGRVHGTDGLIVADASIMPDVPSGFTHIPTIMIAERLSELLASRL
jgi:choline dehydrogenase